MVERLGQYVNLSNRKRYRMVKFIKRRNTKRKKERKKERRKERKKEGTEFGKLSFRRQEISKIGRNNKEVKERRKEERK